MPRRAGERGAFHQVEGNSLVGHAPASPPRAAAASSALTRFRSRHRRVASRVCARRRSVGSLRTLSPAARRFSRQRRHASRCFSRTSGCCGARFSSPVNGPSHSRRSEGGFHGARNGTPERCNAVNAARTLLAIHHRAPAATSSARTRFCDLLATPAFDFSSTKTLRRR